MNAIVLQFIGATDPISSAIEYMGGWLLSHGDAVLPSWDPRPGMLLGSRSDHRGGAPPGVQIRTPCYRPANIVLRVTVPCSEEMEHDYYRLLRAEIGKPYDRISILGIMFGRDWRRPGQWYCTELLAAKAERKPDGCGLFDRLLIPENRIEPDLCACLFAAVPGARHQYLNPETWA